MRPKTYNTGAVKCCETEAFEIEGAGHDLGCIGRKPASAPKRRKEQDRQRARLMREERYTHRRWVMGANGQRWLTSFHPEAKHGTVGAYMHFGCRCEDCSAARAAHRRKKEVR